jgi:membrane fusion protein (multidrug efflux system)
MNPKSFLAKVLPVMWVLASIAFVSGCPNGHTEPKAAAPSAPEVAVVVVEQRDVELSTELPGRTAVYRLAEIRPQVNGMIIKRMFDEGTDVKAGQLLYQIDPAPFQVALDSAKASLGRAQANLPAVRSKAERTRELLTGKVVSQQTYDDALATLKQVEADIVYWQTAVEAARINLGYTRITAPFAGRIGRTTVRYGSLVTAYQPTALTVLQQLNPIYVDVTQSSAELLRLRRSLESGELSADRGSRKVRLILEDGTPYGLEGVLKFSDVTVDPATGSLTVRIEVPNPDQLLLPGMFVRAEVQEGIANQAILVPQQGVSRNPKGDPIALVVNNEEKAEQRKLTLDRAIGNQWLVRAGLSAGDRLIVEGQINVRPGTVVKVRPAQSAGAPDATMTAKSAPVAAK